MHARGALAFHAVDAGIQHRAVLDVKRRTSVMVALGAFAGNRIILLLITLFVHYVFPAGQRGHTLSGLWYRWDALWYIHVATHGYHWIRPPAQSDVAFFPLYPLTIHLLTRIVPFSAYYAGLLIANVSFVVALYLLHRLITHDFPADVAERGVIYLAFFPTALFFFTTYSEALFLVCSLGCFYALRLRRWWLAGLCGMAATLTRQLGIMLVIPFMLDYLDAWQQRRGEGQAELSWRENWNLVALLLIPAGIVAFMAYLQVVMGNGLLFLQAQAAWQRSWALPWTGIILSIQHALDPALELPLRAQNVIDLSFLLAFLSLVILGIGRLPRTYTLYSVAVWLVILLNPATNMQQPLALLSVSRFGLTIFPSFIVLGLIGRHRMVERTLLILFVALLTVFSILFVQGRWVA